MLRTSQILARRAALGVGGTAVIGGGVLTAYAYSEQGLGFRREVQFWSTVSPVVWDYWWNASVNSPKTKYPTLFQDKSIVSCSPDTSPQEKEQEAAEIRTTLLKQLHERNAPKILQVMLDLGGLYIKLGQVLSVSALPIPKVYQQEFRTLQSNVPGHEEFDSVIRPTIEKALGKPLEEVFTEFETVPCGAASIGQAHKAKLRETGQDVIVKVQYPAAKWQVPADIQCVGDFMQLCVWFSLVDESAVKISFEDFSRQFLAELDYQQERENLQQVYLSSLDPQAPYIARGVVLPYVFPELCTKEIITMSYLPGPKFEEEARQQLRMLGFDTNKRGLRSLVLDAVDSQKEAKDQQWTRSEMNEAPSSETAVAPLSWSWKMNLVKWFQNLVGVDSMFLALRFARRVVVWSTAAAVTSIQVASGIVPLDWKVWADAHESAFRLAARMDWTQEAVHALLDVHGYQILRDGLFNADPHPGNILVIQEEDTANQKKKNNTRPKIGLIDYGQCKRLNPVERVQIARLILSVADNESDETIASHFRTLGIKTQNDSTRFLAQFARLMFGSFQPYHLDHDWHKSLHKEDKLLYFPKELSMVYRTSMLLRGLAMSLQYNVAVGEHWRHHAQAAIEQHDKLLLVV